MTTEATLIHVCTSGILAEFKSLELTTEQQMVTAGQIQLALVRLHRGYDASRFLVHLLDVCRKLYIDPSCLCIRDLLHSYLRLHPSQRRWAFVRPFLGRDVTDLLLPLGTDTRPYVDDRPHLRLYGWWRYDGCGYRPLLRHPTKAHLHFKSLWPPGQQQCKRFPDWNDQEWDDRVEPFIVSYQNRMARLTYIVMLRCRLPVVLARFIASFLGGPTFHNGA